MLLFTLIVVAAIMVVYFLSMVPLIDRIVAIQRQAQLYIGMSDRGGTLYSLLQTKSSGICYAEILGDMATQNAPHGIDSALNSTLNKLKGSLEVHGNGKLIKSYGNGSCTLAADIALPGLKKGEVKVL